MYAGRILVSAVDEIGNFSISTLEVGDIFYFPKGAAHTIQGGWACELYMRIAHIIYRFG